MAANLAVEIASFSGLCHRFRSRQFRTPSHAFSKLDSLSIKNMNKTCFVFGMGGKLTNGLVVVLILVSAVPMCDSLAHIK